MPYKSSQRYQILTVIFFFIVLIGVQGFEDPNPKVVKVHNPTHQFLDSFGRTRWFHGTNVVKKWEPWYPANGGPDVCNENSGYRLCDSDMDYLQELGVNVVRLGVMWAGAEPERDAYDAEYFEVTHGIIQRLATRGIYTLVDVHQDVMVKQFCGEGFPDWFAKKDWVTPLQRFPFPQQVAPFHTDERGIPDPWNQCNTINDWFISYLTVGVGNAFGRLYNNYDGLGDSFATYWRKLAVEYGNYTSVLGFDLMNEPWAGDIYAEPTLLIPGAADERVLEPLWNKCNDKIREVDNTTIVFFEGVTWDIHDGHKAVPGKDGTKTAMSYHYYAPPQYTLHRTYQSRLKDQDRLQTGGMLTEFRMWSGDEAVSKEMRDTVDIADIYLQSWMGWEYSSFWNRDNTEIEKHYARTYAPAVAGFVLEMGFNEDNSDYFITWTIDTSITAPTEFKINKRIYYQDGFSFNVTPANAATWKAIDIQNIHLVYTTNAVNGENITVKITNDVTDEPSTYNPSTYNPSTEALIGSGLKLSFNIMLLFINFGVIFPQIL